MCLVRGRSIASFAHDARITTSPTTAMLIETVAPDRHVPGPLTRYACGYQMQATDPEPVYRSKPGPGATTRRLYTYDCLPQDCSGRLDQTRYTPSAGAPSQPVEMCGRTRDDIIAQALQLNHSQDL